MTLGPPEMPTFELALLGSLTPQFVHLTQLGHIDAIRLEFTHETATNSELNSQDASRSAQ